jgi:hypothetical protein
MLRPLPLPDNIPGNLWLTSMPGRFEPLEEFLGWCRGVSANEIVCLVDGEEIAEKSPDYWRTSKTILSSMTFRGQGGGSAKRHLGVR